VETVQSIDFDLDGRTDLLVIDNNKRYKVLLSKGNGMELVDAPSFLPIHKNIKVLLSDITGDGIVDFTIFKDKKSSVTYAHRVKNWDDLKKGQVVSYPQIVEMSSAGVANKISYKSLNATVNSVYRHTVNDNVESWGRGSAVSHVTGSIKVVSEVRSQAPIYAGTNGVDLREIKVSYQYEGLKAQAGGRGSLGFRLLSSIDNYSGVVTTTEYAQQFPYTGMPLATSKIRYDNLATAGDLGFSDITGKIDQNRFGALSQPSSGGLSAFVVGSTPAESDWWKPDSCGNHYRSKFKVVVGPTGYEFKSVKYGTLIECAVSRLDTKSIFTNGLSTSYFPYVAGNAEFSFREDSIAAFAKRTITQYKEKSGYNFSADVESISIGTMELGDKNWSSGYIRAGYSFSGQFENDYLTTTTNEYSQNDFSKWHLGRLTKTTVVHSRENQPSITRVSSFTYDDSNGLLKTSTVEPDKPELTVKTTYGYDSFGNETSKLVESHSTIKSTDAGYFKRMSSASYTSDGRYPEMEYQHLFDGGASNKRLVKKFENYNDLGQPTVVYGALTDHGENLHNTQRRKITYQYDAFGRETSKEDEDAGNLSTTKYRLCSAASCPPIAYSYVESSNTAAPNVRQYSDVMGQTVRASRQLFDGTWAHVDTAYDLMGRQVAVSVPHDKAGYFATGVTSTVTEYDWLSRPKLVEHADGGSITYDYSQDVLSVVQTHTASETPNAPQTKTVWKNALGETTKSIGTNTKSVTRFVYDAQGNTKELVTGESGSTTQVRVVNTYNDVGQKVLTSDPDKGIWEYKYNALGEITRQISGNKKVTDSRYDSLGRLINAKVYSNYNPTTKAVSGLISHIENTYGVVPGGTTVMPGALGKLTQVKDHVTGFYEKYTFGLEQGVIRDKSTHTFIPGQQSYFSKVEFDKYGRVTRSLDASKLTSLNLNALALAGMSGTQNVYNDYGYLKEIVDSSSPNQSRKYYQINKTDLFGNVTEATYGNGVVSHQKFNPITGRLEIKGAKSGNTDLVKFAYGFDDFGNLTKREDYINGTRERFGYTNLNQIETVTLEGLAGLSAKVSSLPAETKRRYAHSNRYEANRPWQLSWTDRATKTSAEARTYVYKSGSNRLVRTTASGGENRDYCYDGNGNQLYSYVANGSIVGEKCAGGSVSKLRDVQYNYFDKPTHIEKGNHKIEFDYGPLRNRTVRRDYENGQLKKTTRYIGSVEHITESNGSTYFKRMLAGVAVEITGGNNQGIKYLHKDHVGSVVAVTDANGQVVERFSFDTYGKRRPVLNLHATGAVSTSVLLTELMQVTDATTNRGFTGHEMLDSVDLIHMNGRVYDPALGLFLSADPYIQNPGSALNTNRYGYVLNNPLSYTDPSGYLIKKLFKAVKRGVTYLGDRINQAGAWVDDNKTTIAIIAVSVWCGPACATWYYGALLGAASGYAQTGTLKGAFVGAVAGAITGGAAGLSSNALTQAAISTVASAVAAGVRSVLQGGQFGNGFRQAGRGGLVSLAATAVVGQPTSDGGKFAMAVIVGGTSSKVSGGKFENGAAFAAFSVAASIVSKPANSKATVGIEEDGGTGTLARECGTGGSATACRTLFDANKNDLNDALEFIAENYPELLTGTNLENPDIEFYMEPGGFRGKAGGYTDPDLSITLNRNYVSKAAFVGTVAHELGHRVSGEWGIYESNLADLLPDGVMTIHEDITFKALEVKNSYE
jgi:RHS repeat-associated protein